MILCFIFVIWKVCLNGLFNNSFCSIVLLGTKKSWIFPYLVNVDFCAVANLLAVFMGVKI